MKKVVIFIVVMFLVLVIIPNVAYAADGSNGKVKGEVSFSWSSYQYWMEIKFHEKGNKNIGVWPEGNGKLYSSRNDGGWFLADIILVKFKSPTHPLGEPVFYIGPIVETNISIPVMEDMWIYGFVVDGGTSVDNVGWQFLEESVARALIEGSIPSPPTPWEPVVSGNIEVKK